MKQPQEIEASYVIPALRKQLAVELSIKNSQKEVSKMLGISDAAVCQYVKAKRAKANINFDRATLKKIRDSAEKIRENKSCTIKEINSLCSFIRKTKCLCRIHKSIEDIKCREGCCCQ